MKLNRMFAWTFGHRAHAAAAALVLADHEGCLNIASLFSDDMQVEPVMTSDVTHIVMRKERAQYWTVEAHVSFVVDDGAEVTFSPYNFDGENDLPKLPTFDEDGKPMNGEPSRWGGESPVELPVHAVVRVLDALDDAVSYGQAGADDDGDLQPRVNEWDNAAMNLWKSVPEGTDAQE